MLLITLSKVFSQINHNKIGIFKNRQSVQTPSGVSALAKPTLAWKNELPFLTRILLFCLDKSHGNGRHELEMRPLRAFKVSGLSLISKSTDREGLTREFHALYLDALIS